MPMPTPDEMRAEFHRLRADLADAMTKLQAKQAAYEKKRAEIIAIEEKELKPLAEAVIATREGLGIHELQKQIALLSRALGGETGAPPAAADAA